MATRILVVDDSPTIRTVVSTILERCGYDPKVASDGQDAYDALASGEVKADLVLLDFVMPHMNGYEFCRAVRNNAELAATPIVLMSARADHIREQFVQQMGALDAITKPFDREALVAAVENALRKVAANANANVKANRTSSARLLPLEPASSTDLGRGTVVAPAEATSRTQVAQVVAHRLASLAAGVLHDHAQHSPLPPAELTAALAQRLSSEAMPELMELLGDLERVDRSRSILSGDLGVVPIGAVLQLLQAENQTGVLVCTSANTSTSAAGSLRPGEPSGAQVRAAFRDGVIDLVQSTGAGDEFRLGRFFVEEGILTPAEIDTITAAPGAQPSSSNLDTPAMPPEVMMGRTEELEALPATTPFNREPHDTRTDTSWRDGPNTVRRPLGMALLATGRIVESQLRSALVRQSSELLYEVIRWPAGRFELRREAPSDLAVSAKLGLPVASVVMEGFRRVDEWRAIERTLGSFDAVLFRDDVAFGTLEVGSLPPKEKAVLDVVDGVRSARAIVAASHLSSFEACRILAQFLEARVLRRRGK